MVLQAIGIASFIASETRTIVKCSYMLTIEVGLLDCRELDDCRRLPPSDFETRARSFGGIPTKISLA